MVLKGFIRQGEYFDSVSLMIVSRELNQFPGIIDSAVVMGTKENREILAAAGLLLEEFTATNDTDLLIALKMEAEIDSAEILSEIDQIFQKLRSGSDDAEDFNPKSLAGGLKQLPDANLSLLSIPGKYAATEAMKALEAGLHVMLFSDNVPLPDELRLKQYAAEKGLLVMGPDCGTAIINGVPLAFANQVKRGDIGLVAASGTGLQEVSCLISHLGKGISQAIGTGGRDVKKEIGGIMFLEGIKALNSDAETKVIVLISKPPDDEVLSKVREALSGVRKPVIAFFLGGDEELVRKTGAVPALSLEQAADYAVKYSSGEMVSPGAYPDPETRQMLKKTAAEEVKRKKNNQKYLRGLYSGGTLCDEAQLICKTEIDNIFSNTPLPGVKALDNSLQSQMHTIIDLGDDEFTIGRPHPMIDFSLRNARIQAEASDPETAVILFDLVLGFGAHPQPLTDFLPTLAKISKKQPEISLICSVIGTEEDPQNRQEVVEALQKLGVIVCRSNARAVLLTLEIIKKLGGR